MIEIQQDSINTEASFLTEEDDVITGSSTHSYIYSGVGEGMVVPSPLDTDNITQVDSLDPSNQTSVIAETDSIDKDNATTDITGGTGSTGSINWILADNLVSEDTLELAQISTIENSIAPIEITSEIVNDWSGGYKLEIDITAIEAVSDWTLDFDFPYEIREVYEVDLADNGDDKYTISGKKGAEDLDIGESITSIFVVDDGGEDAVVPEFDLLETEETATTEATVSSNPESTSKVNNTKSTPDSTPGPISDTTEDTAPTPAPRPTPEPTVDTTPEPTPETTVDTTPEPTPEPTVDTTPEPDEEGSIINVNQDFDGDLDEAIASANDGDIVQLGKNTYTTSGIKFNKDITIDGQKGTVIDGGGTSESIFSLYSGASGATIQDLEITNGNNAIAVNGAANVTLQNLDIHDMGIEETIRAGQNNSGILLDHADGFQVLDSNIYDIGRKAVGINNTDGGTVSGLEIQNINLAAQHAQSFDAGGIKLFNTNKILIQDNYLSDINGFMIWNDTTNATIIEDNVVLNAGEDFQAPDFNNNVYMAGIYNEKSSNAVVRGNKATSEPYFFAFRATEFSTETMTLGENDFSDFELNTTDFWVNEEAEKLIALTEDPDEATFDLISDAFFAQANIGNNVETDK